MATALEQEMSDFLVRYNEAFMIDGEHIAEFYSVPTITMRRRRLDPLLSIP